MRRAKRHGLLTLLALTLLGGLYGCSDAQVVVSREYVTTSPLMISLREKESPDTILHIVKSNPGIIKATESSYRIGPLATALLNQDETVIDLLIEHGADPHVALHSLSNSYPHSFRRYIKPLETRMNSEPGL